MNHVVQFFIVYEFNESATCLKRLAKILRGDGPDTFAMAVSQLRGEPLIPHSFSENVSNQSHIFLTLISVFRRFG